MPISMTGVARPVEFQAVPLQASRVRSEASMMTFDPAMGGWSNVPASRWSSQPSALGEDIKTQWSPLGASPNRRSQPLPADPTRQRSHSHSRPCAQATSRVATRPSPTGARRSPPGRRWGSSRAESTSAASWYSPGPPHRSTLTSPQFLRRPTQCPPPQARTCRYAAAAGQSTRRYGERRSHPRWRRAYRARHSAYSTIASAAVALAARLSL